MASPVVSAPKTRAKIGNPTVIGIDPSMTRTGLCVLTRKGDTGRAKIGSFQSAGHTSDSITTRHDRLTGIAAWVARAFLTHAPTMVMIEGPSFGSKAGSAHDRSGLWWMIVSAAIEADLPLAIVPPTCRMKYATGKGQADKDVVMAAAIRRYGTFLIGNNDEADAVVMAAMGMRHLLAPVEDSLPALNVKALDKIVWPS